MDLSAHSMVLVVICEFHWEVVGNSVKVDIQALLSLVCHVKEGLKHVVEVQGLTCRETHSVLGNAGLGIEERPS